jgi:hypothetical protein
MALLRTDVEKVLKLAEVQALTQKPEGEKK